MPSDEQSQVTRILRATAEGDREPGEGGGPGCDLLPLVYDQLRALAQQRLKEERAGHTLQATALVHEAYIRLVGGEEIGWKGLGHFYVAAAESMRRILIDHARRRGAVKRGGDWRRASLDMVSLASDEDLGRTLALDDALLRLEEEDARAARVVRLRFYAGLGIDETAQAMGVAPRTVKRDWTYARTWLLTDLEREDGATVG